MEIPLVFFNQAAVFEAILHLSAVFCWLCHIRTENLMQLKNVSKTLMLHLINFWYAESVVRNYPFSIY